MERIPKGIYTPGFRAEAVKLVETEGLSVGRGGPQEAFCAEEQPGQLGEGIAGRQVGR